MSKQCLNCGNTVTEAFTRVYGDNNNNVHRCMECVEDLGGRNFLRCGGGAYEDVEKAMRQMNY